MLGLLFFALTLLLFYLAYRAIKGGFETPQSARLNVFGVIGIVAIGLIALSLVSKLFE